jgi:regulator of PEP synthase PpsR (kinase-PPPase family)
MLSESEETAYANPEQVAEEVNFARRLFTRQKWDVIDISRRSIEETAATIIQLHTKYLEQRY